MWIWWTHIFWRRGSKVEFWALNICFPVVFIFPRFICNKTSAMSCMYGHIQPLWRGRVQRILLHFLNKKQFLFTFWTIMPALLLYSSYNQGHNKFEIYQFRWFDACLLHLNLFEFKPIVKYQLSWPEKIQQKYAIATKKYNFHVKKTSFKFVTQEMLVL